LRRPRKVELREQLQEVTGQQVGPDLVDEADRYSTTSSPVGDRGQREELVRVVEHGKDEVVFSFEPDRRQA
jgi:hypothetical protein